MYRYFMNRYQNKSEHLQLFVLQITFHVLVYDKFITSTLDTFIQNNFFGTVLFTWSKHVNKTTKITKSLRNSWSI